MKDGIRCNCVCPGPAFVEDGSWGFLKDAMPDYYEANRLKHPAGRFGKPEEIANAVLFLASDEAQALYATGNFEYPVNPKVPANEIVTSWGSFTPDTLNVAEIARLEPQASKLIDEVQFND